MAWAVIPLPLPLLVLSFVEVLARVISALPSHLPRGTARLLALNILLCLAPLVEQLVYVLALRLTLLDHGGILKGPVGLDSN